MGLFWPWSKHYHKKMLPFSKPDVVLIICVLEVVPQKETWTENR
jgi:hypothetical protein